MIDIVFEPDPDVTAHQHRLRRHRQLERADPGG